MFLILREFKKEERAFVTSFTSRFAPYDDSVDHDLSRVGVGAWMYQGNRELSADFERPVRSQAHPALRDLHGIIGAGFCIDAVVEHN